MDSYLNLENFADYIIAETYYNNGDWIGDWTNNIKMWRSPKVDNKSGITWCMTWILAAVIQEVWMTIVWISRYIRQHLATSNLLRCNARQSDIQKIFHQPIRGSCEYDFQEFRNGCGDASVQDSMEHDMVAHKALWGGTISDWHDDIDDMMNFVNRRPSKARDYVESQFNMTSQVNNTLNASPSVQEEFRSARSFLLHFHGQGIFQWKSVTVTQSLIRDTLLIHFTINSSNNNNQTFTQNF